MEFITFYSSDWTTIMVRRKIGKSISPFLFLLGFFLVSGCDNHIEVKGDSNFIPVGPNKLFPDSGFHSIKTYTFHTGPKHEERKAQLRALEKSYMSTLDSLLEVGFSTKDSAYLSIENKIEENDLVMHFDTEPIVSENGDFCYSAEFISEVSFKEFNQLAKCLKVDPKDNFEFALCYSPKDAIVFFDEKNLVTGYIEICFKCSRSRISPGIEIAFGDKNYKKLAEFLNNKNHQIEYW